jgi:hypothetical protein
MGKCEWIFGLAIFFVFIITSNNSMAMDVDECKTCHADSYDKWKESDHSQKIECQNCHMLAEDNFAKHITNPSLFTL